MARIPFTVEFEDISKWDESKLDAYLNQIAAPQSDERQYRRATGGTESISKPEDTVYGEPYLSKLLPCNWGIDVGKGASESIVRDNNWYNTEEFNSGHGKISSMELPELDNLEKADTFVKTQSEKVQAYLYKALYLNDMRIDKAETIISRDKK